MGTDKLVFAVVLCGGATGSDVSHVTGRDVNHRNRKYVMRMRKWKLRNIRPSGAFLIRSDVSHVTGSMFCACPAFPRVFFSY
jgi:hypothetical protein